MKNLWRLWAKSLGEKAGSTDKEADKVAVIRTIIIVYALLTNTAICLNLYLSHFR